MSPKHPSSASDPSGPGGTEGHVLKAAQQGRGPVLTQQWGMNQWNQAGGINKQSLLQKDICPGACCLSRKLPLHMTQKTLRVLHA